jgi:hypothetical protein
MLHPPLTLSGWLNNQVQKDSFRQLATIVTHPAAYLFYISLLAYGLLLPFLGLYGDDWEFLYAYYRHGSAGFDEVVGWMRPYSVLVYSMIAPVLGLNILAYHIYVFILRWLTAVLVWKMIKLLHPDQDQSALWVAGLFLIYPAFYQQTLPLSFSLHFSVQVMFLTSIVAMLYSLNASGLRSIILTIIGVGLTFSVFIIEYFAGLEFIRPVLLWWALRGEALGTRLRRSVITWMPYLGVQGLYLAWRIFFFESGYQDPIIVETLQTDPSGTFSNLFVKVFDTLNGVIFTAWGSVFRVTQGKSGWFHLGLVGLTALGSLIYFRRMSWGKAYVDSPKQTFPFLWIGCLALLVSGLPLWSSALRYEQGFPADRLSLPFVLGCSLFWVGLVTFLLRRRYHVIAIVIMISLSIGAQFLNANSFRRKADELRQYFWQLTWRMPGLEPGTFLLTQKIPLGYYSDNNLTPLLLWTYSPQDRTDTDMYRFFDFEVREGNVIPALQSDSPVDHYTFQSNAGRAVVIFSTSNDCVRILTAQDPLVNIPEALSRAVSLSNLGQIITQPADPATPPDLLGPEPAHGWCYYFSKADLSRQQQDWEAVSALGDEAFGQGLDAATPAELYPFIYGYAYSNQIERAIQLSERPRAEVNYLPSLCRAWETIDQNLTDKGQKVVIQDYLDSLNCTAILSNP